MKPKPPDPPSMRLLSKVGVAVSIILMIASLIFLAVLTLGKSYRIPSEEAYAVPAMEVVTPISDTYGSRLMLRGVVESAEDIGDGKVRIALYDDANCTHEIILNGRAKDFYVEEYNRITISHITNRSWGSVEETFLGEDQPPPYPDQGSKQ